MAELRHRPRVLHVGPLPPPLGGIEMALQSLLRAPGLQAFDQCVYNTSRGRPMSRVGRKAVTVARVGRRLRILGGLLRAVRRQRPDVVHFHLGSDGAFDAGSFLAMLWAVRPLVRSIVLHLHTDFAVAAFPGRGAASRAIFRLLASPAHALFVPTDAHRDTLAGAGLRGATLVVPNMCDESLLALPLRRPDVAGRVTAIFVGRLTTAKGIFDLLDIATQLRERRVPVRIEVAGLPSSEADGVRLAALISDRGLGDVVCLLGAVTGEAKARLFERADLLLFPTHTESFGIVALEAMAAALPVVATDCTGLAALVEPGRTGYLAPRGDVCAFADHVERLALDADLRWALGAAGRARFEGRFTARRVAADLAAAYDTLLSGAARGDPFETAERESNSTAAAPAGGDERLLDTRVAQ